MPPQPPTARDARPDALALFTDRVEQQQLLRQLLSPAPTGPGLPLLTQFYGVGGVGKSTLCRRACEIAEKEFKGVVSVAVTSFDESRWKAGTPFTEVCAELCRCLVRQNVVPRLALALLYLHNQQTGREGEAVGGLDAGWSMAFSAMEKGAELTGIPGLGMFVKAAQWVRDRAQRQTLRKRLNELALWPVERYGRLNVEDLEKKLATAVFHDLVGWLRENPGLRLRLFLDGFERLQGGAPGQDSQRRLQEFIGYFAGPEDREACNRFRVVIFGRNRLRWEELYEDPAWRDCWGLHMLDGLAEEDAREFLRKVRTWLSARGQTDLAGAIERHEDRILDASDETQGGDRVIYPFYLDLAVELVDRARRSGREPDFGNAPAELQGRFFRYLDPGELRALMILSLSEVFDENLFDWLALHHLIAYPQHSFRTHLWGGSSYLQPVEGGAGNWRFHRLMEDALHSRWRSSNDLKEEGAQLVKRLLEFYGRQLLAKPERDWGAVEIELWRRGMEMLITQGPELELLSADAWAALLTFDPWSTKHYLCIEHCLDFERRIRKERERIFGPDHPDTLSSVNTLGILLSDKGDYTGEEQMFRRALAGREKTFGPNHPHTLSSLNNLGGPLYKKGDYAGAEEMYRRALTGKEKALGPDHPDTLNSVNNLGVLLRAKGDYAGAEEMYRRALMGMEKALGPDHPDTLKSVNNLGNLLSDKGDYTGAEEMHRRALAGMEKALGPDHPDTLKSVNNLGNLLSDKGDYAGAEEMHRRALAGMEKVLGPHHPDTLSSSNDLGNLLSKKGDYGGAEQLYRRTLAGMEKALGPDHPDTLASVNNLGSLLNAKGDLPAALELLRVRSSLSEQALRHLRYNLACYECLSGNLDNAKELIAVEINSRPRSLDEALEDDDLKTIREFINSLPRSLSAEDPPVIEA